MWTFSAPVGLGLHRGGGVEPAQRGCGVLEWAQAAGYRGPGVLLGIAEWARVPLEDLVTALGRCRLMGAILRSGHAR